MTKQKGEYESSEGRGGCTYSKQGEINLTEETVCDTKAAEM